MSNVKNETSTVITRISQIHEDLKKRMNRRDCGDCSGDCSPDCSDYGLISKNHQSTDCSGDCAKMEYSSVSEKHQYSECGEDCRGFPSPDDPEDYRHTAEKIGKFGFFSKDTSGNYFFDLEKIEGALKENASDVSALKAKATYYENHNQWESALSVYQLLKKLLPNNDLWMQIKSAAIHVNIGDYDGAITICKQILLKTPNNLLAHSTLFKAYCKQANYSEASAVLSNLIKTNQGKQLASSLQHYLDACRESEAAVENTLSKHLT